MQLNDIMPYDSRVNVHDLMLRPIQLVDSGAWTECERHWDKLFSGTIDATKHRENVYSIFKNFIKTFG